MMKLHKKMKALNESAVATDGERAAIKAVIERAQKILPGTRVRYIERAPDVVDTLLIVGLVSPNLDDPQNFELHAIVDGLEDYDGLSLLVTEDSEPTKDNQLLKLTSFLTADEIAADLKEPMHYNVFFRPAHQQMLENWKRDKVFFFAGILALVIYWFLYLPLSKMAETHFPQIFGRDLVGTKFERRIGFVRLTVDDAIKEIDTEIHKLTLTKEQVQELEADKTLLEKAKRDLGASEAVK